MPFTLRRRAATLMIVAAGAAAAGAAPAQAAPTPVEGGSLAWHAVNAFDDTNGRTWFGYVTAPTLANGAITPLAPAFGPTLTGTSPRTATPVRWGVPAVAGGTYDPDTREGEIAFDGGLEFDGTAHGFTYSLEGPRIELTGTTGKLYASGVRFPSGANPATTYDDSQPVFDLDLSGATVSGNRISGIVPRIATADLAFPANYPAGAGPDRTPNTFGGFTLSLGASLSASPTADLDPAGTAVTVTGEGFKTTGGAGVYLFFGPVDAPFATDTVEPVAFLPNGAPNGVHADGSFTATLTVKATGGTGAGAFDCAEVACAVRTVQAHTNTDPSQRTAVPVTFAAPAEPAPTPTPTPTPGPDPTPLPTPDTGIQGVPQAPVVSGVVLRRKRLVLSVSTASTVTARIHRRVVRRVNRNGKVRRVARLKLVKTVTLQAGAAGEYRAKLSLRPGRYRVTVRAVGTTGLKSRAVTAKLRLK